MVDLAMLRALLDAVRPEATLILVGDADQLTSVAAGSVLMDLVAAMEAQRAADIVRLEHSFRAERQLVPINRAVRAGDARGLREAIAAAGADARWRTVADAEALRRALAEWCEQLAALPIRDTAAFARRRRGPRRACGAGTARAGPAATAGRAARRELRCAGPECVDRATAQAPLGRTRGPRVVCRPRRADHAQRLRRAAVQRRRRPVPGRARRLAAGVVRNRHRSDGHASARSFAPGTLPLHEGGFAITVHKSQGSEYDLAAVLLPPDPQHRILSRQLLYTGLSRARSRWSCGRARGRGSALARPVRRASGLVARLSRDTA